MATTGTNFVYVTGSNGVLNGSTVSTPPFLDSYGPKEAMSVSQLDQVAGGSGAATASNASVADRLTFDPSLTAIPPVGSPHPVPEVYGTMLGGYAKNGAVYLSLSGTTAQSIDFTNTTINTPAGTAGDTVFATLNVIRVKWLGTGTLAISPGASNPARLPTFSGTTPALVMDAGSEVLFHSAAGDTVDSTHKVLTFTPSATGVAIITACGA